MEQYCCCRCGFSIRISTYSYYTDLHVEVLFLVSLHVEGMSAKGKVREIHFPYLPKNGAFPIMWKVRFLDFSLIRLSVLADNL